MFLRMTHIYLQNLTSNDIEILRVDFLVVVQNRF